MYSQYISPAICQHMRKYMQTPVFEITQTFKFDSAHFLSDREGRPEYGRVHGHSFVCEVSLSGARIPGEDWIVDFAAFETALNEVGGLLDHQFLNEIEGLETPTMENISEWIAGHLSGWLKDRVSEGQELAITKVKLMRPTIGQTCTFRPA